MMFDWMRVALRGIRERLRTPSVPETFGLSDAEFLLRCLQACPVGSVLDVCQYESEHWVRRMAKWAIRENNKQFEADGYLITPESVEVIDELLREDPSELDGLYHLYITGPGGEALMQSLDNLTDVPLLDDRLRRALEARSD